MAVFEPGTSVDGSNYLANCATTISQFFLFFFTKDENRDIYQVMH